MINYSSTTSRSRGFTLLEVAIVLTVIGLVVLVGSSTLPWVSQEGTLEKSRGAMAEASNAILAFSLTNNRLPCPADPALSFGDPGFGTEDCARDTGAVPFEALLLSAPGADMSHRPVVYAVYRNSGIQSDLAAVANLFDGLDEPQAVLNRHDYCAALKNGDPAAGTGYASTTTSVTTGGCLASIFVNQAFVLSSAGLEDADGDADPFDGDNVDGNPLCFASPDQGRSAFYDDLVTAVSFASILGKVCR